MVKLEGNICVDLCYFLFLFIFIPMILYFKNRIVRWSLISSIVLNLLLWILYYFRIPIQTEPIVLRYNIYAGINLIGPWYNVFYFPLAGIILIVLNFILGKFLFKRSKLIAEFLAITALICQIILLAFGILIVMINI